MSQFVLLLIVGLLGVLCQAVKKMNELNTRNNGKFKLADYMAIERFVLLNSILFVIAAAVFCVNNESMVEAGNYLLVGQFTLGYFGQSALELVMGQAAKKLGIDIPKDQEKPPADKT